jgi:hypothetical protein
MSDLPLGNVPVSVLDDSDNIIFTEGQYAKKIPYLDMKNDMLGSANLSTTAPTSKEAINELVQDLLEATGYGIVNGGVVSAQSTPNMTVNVTSCTLKTATGARQVVSANASLAITTADTTNPRKDIVYVNSTGVISYLQGTAAASPISPTTPVGASLLAEIYIAANASSITNANITDKRKILISTDWINTQLSDSTKIINPVDDTGSVNTYVITLPTAPTAYAKYQTFRFIAKTTNTGASTINVNGLGAKTLVKDVNKPLIAGDIQIGQIVTAIYDGTNFQIVPNLLGKANLSTTPQKTTADITYYVNASTGLDTNDGLTSGAAFKTIAKAVSMLPQTIQHNVTIQLAPGTYAETVNLYGYNGGGTINIKGGNTLGESVNYIVKNVYTWLVLCRTVIMGITTNSTTDNHFQVYITSCTVIQNCNSTIVAGNLHGVYANGGGTVNLYYNNFSYKGGALVASYGSTIISEGNTGSGNTTALIADRGGVIDKVGTQPTGTTAEIASNGGVIR